MKKDSSIICLSGGLDSATALAKYADGIKVCAFIHYGSKQNDREEKASRELAAYYGKQWVRIDAGKIFRDFDSALLANSSRELPVGRYDNIEVCSAKVPFRNGIFISMLVGLAESFKLEEVIVGVHSGDHRLYPDCTPKFISAMNNAISAYSGDEIAIFAPFIGMSKKEIADIAWKCGLPINLTYSCYNGGEEHCGVCPTCIERREAIGEDDPTIYERKFVEIFSPQDCYAIFNDRRGEYGDNSFQQHKDKLAALIGAIDGAKPEKIDLFFAAMLAHKAHRFKLNQKKADSAIDFANYLYLAKSAGFGERVKFKSDEASRKLFVCGDIYNAYFENDASFEEVVAEINKRGDI